MSGSSRSGRRVNAITPSTTSNRLPTVASTGRWMEMSEIFIPRRRRAFAPASTTLLPSCSLTMPSTTMRSPGFSPDAISTLPSWRLPSVTGTSATASPAPTREHAGLRTFLLHRDFRQHQRLASGRRTATRSSMPARRRPSGWAAARAPPPRGCPDRRGCRCRRRRLRTRRRATRRCARRSPVRARARQRGFGHGEIELDARIVVERGDGRAGPTSAPTLTRRRPSTPANGATRVRSATAARRGERGGGGVAVGAQGVELALRDQLLARVRCRGAAAARRRAGRFARRRRRRVARCCSCPPATARRGPVRRCRTPAASPRRWPWR